MQLYNISSTHNSLSNNKISHYPLNKHFRNIFHETVTSTWCKYFVDTDNLFGKQRSQTGHRFQRTINTHHVPTDNFDQVLLYQLSSFFNNCLPLHKFEVK